MYTLFIHSNRSAETYVYKEETVARGNLILGIMESGSLTLGESAVMPACGNRRLISRCGAASFLYAAVIDALSAQQEIYDYSVDSLSDAVIRAQNELDEIQMKMDAFREFVGEDNRIYAPEDGLVTGVSSEAGDKLKDIGAMLTYAKENEYTVNIDVSEEDVAAISVGEYAVELCKSVSSYLLFELVYAAFASS